MDHVAWPWPWTFSVPQRRGRCPALLVGEKLVTVVAAGELDQAAEAVLA